MVLKRDVSIYVTLTRFENDVKRMVPQTYYDVREIRFREFENDVKRMVLKQGASNPMRDRMV